MYFEYYARLYVGTEYLTKICVPHIFDKNMYTLNNT